MPAVDFKLNTQVLNLPASKIESGSAGTVELDDWGVLSTRDLRAGRPVAVKDWDDQVLGYVSYEAAKAAVDKLYPSRNAGLSPLHRKTIRLAASLSTADRAAVLAALKQTTD